MSLRSRLERLERRRPAGVSIWQVIWGVREAEDLDEAGKELLGRLRADADGTRDPIEEAIAAALSGAAVPPPPGDAGPSPPNGEDDRG